jgi:8-oxo-dGTP pyrophosphatase MutT (NUDIX family)/GNAT superfamily N-acetyltransferase
MVETRLRDQLRRQIAARTGVDQRETVSLSRFLAEFDRLGRPFDEESNPTHVTASAVVIGLRGVVLHRHKRLGIWLQPGGHIDSGELPADAAVRETLEETGLAVVHAGGEPAIIHVDVHPGPRGHTHLDVRYLLVAGDEDPRPPAGESPDARWFSWAEAIDMSDGGLSGILRSLNPADADVEIRPATTQDARHLAEIFCRSRQLVMPPFVWPHDDDEVRAWIPNVVVPRGSTWVATISGLPIAMMVTGDGWIEHLYVDPPWIGHGVGARLLQYACGLLPDGVQLWTFQANVRARAFYERHGFVAVEFTDGAGNEERQPDVRYEWPSLGRVASVPA